MSIDIQLCKTISKEHTVTHRALKHNLSLFKEKESVFSKTLRLINSLAESPTIRSKTKKIRFYLGG